MKENTMRKETVEDEIDERVFNIIYTIFFCVCPLVLFTLLIRALDGRYDNWAYACIMLCVYPAVYIAFLLIKLITLIISSNKDEGPQEE